MDSRELNQLAENVANLRRQKVWLDNLKKLASTARANSDRLQKELRAEQKDVERLEHSALTRFVLTMFDDAKLEREQQEAAEALIRWQQANAETQTLEAEVTRTTAQVRQLGELENRYQLAIEEQTHNLLKSEPVAGELRRKIGEEETLRNRCHLLRRAQGSAKAALAQLQIAAAKVGTARSWGKFDLWGGGGTLSSHLKRSRIDEAASAVVEAQIHMDSLRLELLELGETPYFPSIDTAVGHRVMDVFLDNIFTDLKVQRRIEEMQKSIQQAVEAVDRHGGQLERDRTEAERSLTQAIASREQFIREAGR